MKHNKPLTKKQINKIYAKAHSEALVSILLDIMRPTFNKVYSVK